jgi:protein involved in polysaccharide export with SLBB domain
MRKNAILFLILSIGLAQTIFAQENMPVSSVKAYLLTPGDEIITRVLGEKDFDFEAIVDENGNIEVPYFDEPVKAMCKTERELRLEVSKLLGKYLKTPQVSLRVKERNKNSNPVKVFGEVRTPSQFILMRQYRLKEIMAQVGGANIEAAGIIQVTHIGLPPCASAEEIAEWKSSATDSSDSQTIIYKINEVEKGMVNPVVYPGDIIHVPIAKPVFVVGKVRQPQGVYIKADGLTLFEAIQKLGGADRKEANLKEVRIYSLKSEVKDVTSVSEKDRDLKIVDYEAIVKTQKGDVLLKPYDIVVVDERKKPFAEVFRELAIGGARTIFQGVTSGVGPKILY